MAVKREAFVPDDLDAAVKDLAIMLGSSTAELIRCGLGMVIQVAAYQAARAARAGAGPQARRCPLCREPRRADPISDVMAHAQCDQLMDRFARELADVG
jgi:hypothetical protein